MYSYLSNAFLRPCNEHGHNKASYNKKSQCKIFPPEVHRFHLIHPRTNKPSISDRQPGYADGEKAISHGCSQASRPAPINKWDVHVRSQGTQHPPNPQVRQKKHYEHNDVSGSLTVSDNPADNSAKEPMSRRQEIM